MKNTQEIINQQSVDNTAPFLNPVLGTKYDAKITVKMQLVIPMMAPLLKFIEA